MSTPTPTSNPGAAEIPSIAALAQLGTLPDEASLAQLASSFFAALPGQAPSGVDLAPLAPASPDLGLSQLGHAPAIAPAPIAGTESIASRGGSEYGVPSAYAASLPQVGAPSSAPENFEAAPVFTPSTPYYFVGEASPYVTPAQSSVRPDEENRVVAQSFGLPGETELQRLLADIAGERKTASSADARAASSYYFLAPAAPTQGAAAVPAATPTLQPGFDINRVRRDFPVLAERVNGKPLIWFDNAATTHKPQAVIDRLAWFYAHENSNIHRAAHELAARATDAYEAAREKVARFIGAGSKDEIVFVRGATEAVNLVAQTWGRQNIGEGDEIIVSLLEHHANIVPWQQLAAEKGAVIRVIPVDDRGQLKLEEYQKLLNNRTKLVAVTQVSNALGTVVPVKAVIDAAHAAGAKVLVDGAQSVSHLRVNLQTLDADFFVFSGHKLYAPTGIGVVYGKKSLLDSMPPWQGGGNMIADVTFERTQYQPAPAKFEAGTGNIADAVGLGAAIDYLERIGIENIARYEHGLLAYATRGLLTVPGLRLIGTAEEKTSVLSFVLDGYKPEEVGRAFNQEGIAVRSGHHCAQPILRRFGLEATVRPSIAFYNTCQEVDTMIAVLHRLVRGKGEPAADIR